VTAIDGDGLLKKLDNATKSFLYVLFTMQLLSADYPADAIIDYQLNKVTGNSIDMFDNNLDLLAFPELFPTGTNGIKDILREVKIGTSAYIKSRLLNKDSNSVLTSITFSTVSRRKRSVTCATVSDICCER